MSPAIGSVVEVGVMLAAPSSDDFRNVRVGIIIHGKACLLHRKFASQGLAIGCAFPGTAVLAGVLSPRL